MINQFPIHWHSQPPSPCHGAGSCEIYTPLHTPHSITPSDVQHQWRKSNDFPGPTFLRESFHGCSPHYCSPETAPSNLTSSSPIQTPLFTFHQPLVYGGSAVLTSEAQWGGQWSESIKQALRVGELRACGLRDGPSRTTSVLCFQTHWPPTFSPVTLSREGSHSRSKLRFFFF